MPPMVQRILVAWALLALVGWALIFLAQRAISFPQIGYYVVLLPGIGLPIWLNRARLGSPFNRLLPFSPLLRFLILGYGMVLLEEILAAIFNHLLEGFDLATLPIRIAQFWAFNILAFTGLIWSWYLLRRLFAYSLRESFFLAGCFGLFAEHTIELLAGNVLLFVLLAPLNILTYGTILTPAFLSLPKGAVRRLPPVVGYVAALLLPVLASIPPVAVLGILRFHFPDAFPPCRFIAC